MPTHIVELVDEDDELFHREEITCRNLDGSPVPDEEFFELARQSVVEDNKCSPETARTLKGRFAD